MHAARLGPPWVYGLSAVLMVVLAVVLRVLLPVRRPHSALGYLGLLSFVPTLGAAAGGKVNLGILVAAAIALDFAVSGNLVPGQRAIYALGAEVRGRVNGIYMATFFLELRARRLAGRVRRGDGMDRGDVCRVPDGTPAVITSWS